MATSILSEGELLRRLLDDAAVAARRDEDLCLALLEEAAPLLERQSDPEPVARMNSIRAEVELARGNGPDAWQSYQAARMAWLGAGRQLEARGALLGQTAALLAIGEYDDVVARVGRIRSGLEHGSLDDEHLATRLHLRAHQQLGTAHAANGSIAVAMRHLDLADDLARTVDDDHEAATVGLIRGRALMADGLLHRALDVLCDARRMFLRAGSVPSATLAVLPITEALTLIGEPAAAMGLLDRIRPAFEGHPGHVAEWDLAQAGALLASGLALEAFGLALAARDAFRDAGLIAGCARAELMCARISLRLGRGDPTVELLAAERLSMVCGDAFTRDRARLLIGRNAASTGDTATALRIGRGLVQEAISPGAVIEAQMLMMQATDDLEEAESIIAGASARVDHVGRPELRVDLRVARARHLLRLGRTSDAIDELRAACDMEEQLLRRGAVRAHSEGSLAETTDQLIDLLVEQGTYAALIEAWRRVRTAKAWDFSAMHAGAQGWQVEEDPSGLEDIDLLIARARGARRIAPGAGPADLLEVPEGPLLEYYVLGEDVLAFVIREGQVHVRRIAGASGVTHELAAAWQHECLLAAVAGTPQGSSPALDNCYTRLVQPLTDLLGDIGTEEVGVAGHRHLTDLPLDAMLDLGAPWRARLVADVCLGEELIEQISGRAAAPPAVLVIAVPDEHAPAIALEAAMISRTLPDVEVHLGDDATAERLAEQLPKADLVHIATHGRFRRGNPLFSALKLGDGWLTASDMADGRFDMAGLVVVLSACGSGRGSDHAAQPVGLAWACLNAGAVGVVASLWPIDDQVTVSLMTEFYAELAAGTHPRQALGRARRRVAQAHPHPYHWAAFRYFSADD